MKKVSLIIEFCKKNDHPDFAIRRVGVYAGKLILENLDGLSSQSHYFCKTKGITLAEFQVLYQKIKYEHDNTVGPRSISKQEIVDKL